MREIKMPLLNKIITYYKNKITDYEVKEICNRVAALIEFKFTTVANEQFIIKKWIGIGKLSSGVKSANSLMMHELYINGTSFSKQHIVKIDSVVIKYGIISEKFKRSNNRGTVSNWDMMWEFDESVIEQIVTDEALIKAFNQIYY